MASSPAAAPANPDPKVPIPRQIPYIIGNEGCERFSFYGMRNILTVFLVSSLLAYLPEGDRAGAAKDVFHTFVIGVYFFPLLGGWIADRFFGKYNTILWLSLVYCAGHLCLALFESNRTGFFTGLCQPSMLRCRPRPRPRVCAGTSSVITEPAPVVAPSPSVSGATSELLEPMNTSSPITVRNLLAPS